MIKIKEFICIVAVISASIPTVKGMDEDSDDHPRKSHLLKGLFSSHPKAPHKEHHHPPIRTEQENDPEKLYNLGLQLAQKRISKKSEDTGKETEYFRQAALQGHRLALSQLDNLDPKGAQEIRQGFAKKVYFDFMGQEPKNLSEGAMLNSLGMGYYEGFNKSNKNLHEACKYYQLSAKLGDINGQHNLGHEYYYGNELPKNFKKAFHYYKLSADQGDKSSSCMTGYMYYRGEGISQDIKEAFKYYKFAADLGCQKGQYMVGRLYLEGKGVKKDPNAALKYFTLSAHQGHKLSLNKLDVRAPQASLLIRRDLAKAKNPDAIVYFQNLLTNIPQPDQKSILEAEQKIDSVRKELIAKDAKYIRFYSLAEGNMAGIMSERDGSYKGTFKSCYNEQLKIHEETISKELNRYQLLVEQLRTPGTLISCLDITNKSLLPFKEMKTIFSHDDIILSTYFSFIETNTNILFSQVGINTLEELGKIYKNAADLLPGIEIFIAQYPMDNNRPSLDLWINTILKSNPTLGEFISCYLEDFPHVNKEKDQSIIGKNPNDIKSKEESLSKQQSLYLENLRVYFDDCQRDLITDVKYMKSLKSKIYNLIKVTTEYRNYLFLIDIGLMNKV